MPFPRSALPFLSRTTPPSASAVAIAADMVRVLLHSGAAAARPALFAAGFAEAEVRRFGHGAEIEAKAVLAIKARLKGAPVAAAADRGRDARRLA